MNSPWSQSLRSALYLCSAIRRRIPRSGLRSVLVILAVALSSSVPTRAQRTKDQGEFSRFAGDAPRRARPYANDLSAVLARKNVSAALARVADWQLKRAEQHFDNDWTFAVLYAGFMAIPEAVAGDKYKQAMKSMGYSLHWAPGPDELDANDLAVGQTYLALYELDENPVMIQQFKDRVDAVLSHAPTQPRPLWWWCDALFMAPAALAELSRITGDQRYLEYMDKQWWMTSSQLYDSKHALYFRDQRFLTRQEANGEPIFWSRGNGWVLAGLARVLKAMPRDYPSRPRYVAQFQQMAASLAALQRPNGLWTAGLLDAASYPSDETSGSALIAYGLAYGVNSGLLDRAKYQPDVELAWHGLLAHIFVDGRLGSIQKVADSPGHVKPTSSYVYGVGAFLLAGSEVYVMAPK